MSEGATESLVCAVCKQSCEGKPHAKDTKGRVICRECIDKKKAARAATDTGGAGVMADLLSKSKMANATPCPGCKSYMAEGTVVCTHCGYNLQTGKAINTRVVDAPKEKKVKEHSGGPSMSFDPMMGVWVMAVVYLGLAIGVFALPDLLSVLALIVFVAGLIVYLWMVVTAFLDHKLLWGVLMLIPLVNVVSIIYVLFITDRTVLRAHWLMVVATNILVGLLATSFAPETTAAIDRPASFATQLSSPHGGCHTTPAGAVSG